MNQSTLPKLKQSNLARLSEKISQFARTRAYRCLATLIEAVFIASMVFHTYVWGRLVIEGTGGNWLPSILLVANIALLALTVRSYFKKD